MSIEAESADGKVHEFPDGTDRTVIDKVMKDYAAKQPSAVMDSLQSFGRGVAQGAIGLAGLPGDVADMTNRGIDAAESYFMDIKPKPLAPNTFGSENIQRNVEKVTGKFEEPKTTAGKYAQSAGQFVPAMLGGPESLAVKAAGALGGGVLSEAAGEATEGSALETPARMLGGALGGGAAGAFKNERQRLAGASQLKGGPEIKAASQGAYTELEQLPTAISRGGIENLQKTVTTALRQESYHPRTAGTTYGFVEDIANHGLNNKPARISDIVDIHEQLGHVSPQVNAKDAAAAQVAREAIRNWLTKNAPEANKPLKNALGNWSAHKKLEDLTAGQTTAGHRAGVSGTGANFTNTMRQEIRKILDSKSRSRGYKPEELAQMEKIVMGTIEANASRLGGKLAPTSLISIAADKIMGMPFIGAVGALASKQIGEFLTKREIEKLLTMVQERAPVNAQQAAENKAALAAQPSAKGMAARGAVAGAQQPSANDYLANPGQQGLQ